MVLNKAVPTKESSTLYVSIGLGAKPDTASVDGAVSTDMRQEVRVADMFR
jgi:hypothetical protein